MVEVEIFHCNKTYNEAWLQEKKASNGIQFKIIQAIIILIQKNEGGAITQKELLELDTEIKEYLERRRYRTIPSSGTEMTGNGRGIHHAKYSPTKSVAVLWSVIKSKAYVTFDDHAPVKYHRAIYCFHQLRLGRQVFEMQPRCSPKMREILKSKKPWIYKGVNPRDRYYYSK